MKSVLFFFFLSLGLMVNAQEMKPVTWSGSICADCDQSAILLHADIEEGWHLYSQNLPSDEGPVPTSFSTEVLKGDVQLSNDVSEGEAHKAYDQNFMMDVFYFGENADFEIPYQKNDEEAAVVEITVTFMVCNDEMCLPPKDEKIQVTL